MDAPYYEKDGQRYDRITRILDACWPNPGLLDWKLTVGRAQAKAASRHGLKIGTEVDRAISSYWAGQPPKLTHVDSRFAYRAFLEYQALRDLKPVSWQLTVYDEALKVAGTLDYHDTEEVIDWKSSQRFEASHVLQVCKYAQLLWRTYHVNTKRIRLVRLDKMLGTYEEWLVPETLWIQAWEVFDGLVPAYRALMDATFERG